MISPWTIYKDQKESSPNPSQGKKSKQNHIKSMKRVQKNSQNKSLMLSEAQSGMKVIENPYQGRNDDQMIQYSDQVQSQDRLINDANINNPQQNKIQPIQQEIGLQHQQDVDDPEQLFRGLDHPQLIKDQARSKDFLRNIVSDPLSGGYLDNSKLLQFCKNQSPHNLYNNQAQSPKKRRFITNLMHIQSQKLSLIQEWNSLVLMKCIKSTLRVEEAIEREVDNNIEVVLEKLKQEFLPRMSPQELLLEKLLRNQQEKMAKDKQQRKLSNSQLPGQDNHGIEKSGQVSKNKPLKRPKKQKQLSSSQIMQTLQQDIQKSSIIKYLNSSESPYLQAHQSSKKSQKIHHNTSLKPKDSINSIQISVNNAKLSQKLIYVNKKPVSNKLNHQNNQKQPDQQSIQIDAYEKSENNEAQNPQLQLNEKQNRKSPKRQQKDNIQKLIKQHMAIRQPKKQGKSTQNEQGVEKIEFEVRKLKGKNYIVLQNLSSPDKQSNLISPKLHKSRTIDLINHQNLTNKKSKPHLQSPLMPPQFQLPQLSHRTLEPDHKKMSSSSKLLELITNNILQQKYKNHKRNSTEDQKSSSNLIDQLFIKDKEKKQVMMRRNHSVNVNNTKEILREMNRKKMLNLDEQILELKETQKVINGMGQGKQENESQENQLKNTKQPEVMNAMKKDFLTNNSMDQNYNFMRKKPHKLTPLQTQLIGLIEVDNHHKTQKQDTEGKGMKKALLADQEMNKSDMKFSDWQINHDMNLRINNSRRISKD